MDYCGIDLHQDKSYICLLDEEGEMMERATVRTTRRALSKYHWAVSVPIARTKPKIAKRYVDHNDYPREAMFEAILRFVEEDLDSRINRVD